MSLEGADVPFMRDTTISELFEIVTYSRPFSTALYDAMDDSTILYNALNARVNQLARYLLKHLNSVVCRNPDGDRVIALCMKPSTQLIVAILAIEKVCCAYLPIDVNFTPSRASYVLQDALPYMILHEGRPSALEGITDAIVNAGIIPLELSGGNDGISSEPDGNLDPSEVGCALTSEAVAAILYTSGSTGVPKGVRISHRAILSRLTWQWNAFLYREDEVGCFKTALTFVDSISEIFGTLLIGRRLVVVPQETTRSVEGLVALLEDQAVTRLVLVPSLLSAVLLCCSRASSPKLEKLILWTCSGEEFPVELLHNFFEVFSKNQVICNFYGSTEVMGDVTYCVFRGLEDCRRKIANNKVPIGGPLSNCKIYLMSPEMKLVEEGKMGEIVVSGANLSLGYVGIKEDRNFVENPFQNYNEDHGMIYRTGDFGRISEGHLVFEGRLDSQIKIRGHRVDMSEVEAGIQRFPGIRRCCVVCYAPGQPDQNLLAFYSSDDPTLTPMTLASQLSSVLVSYMRPQLLRLEELPYLVNGKVDRQELLRRYEATSRTLDEIPIDTSAVPPHQSRRAKDLLLTVARVLGPSCPDSLSLKDNFFEIGGNSLNSILAITSLCSIGYDVGIENFLQAKSFLDLLALLDEKEQDEGNEGNKGSVCSFENSDEANYGSYACFPVLEEHRARVTEIVSKSFTYKGDLERLTQVCEDDLKEMVDQMWDDVIRDDLSFLVRDGSSKVVAVSVNLDYESGPEFVSQSRTFQYVLDILEDLEKKVGPAEGTRRSPLLHPDGH